MKDSPFRLQDKTILVTGPFNSITQALLRTMTELGADIAFVNPDTPNASKYCDGVNEAREARPDFGRSAHFALPLNQEAEVRDALGRLAESIGRVDVFVDATPLAWGPDADVDANLKKSMMIADQLLPFFKARQRGRIVYLFEDASLSDFGVAGFVSNYQDRLASHIVDAAGYLRGAAVTVNGIAVGVSEDFILRHFPQAGSIKKALLEMQKQKPSAKIIEALEVASALAYLACPASGSLTGQILRLA